jgi:hypothetical protein
MTIQETMNNMKEQSRAGNQRVQIQSKGYGRIRDEQRRVFVTKKFVSR